MKGDTFKRGDWILWEGFDEGGGALIYYGQVVGVDQGQVTGETYYIIHLPDLQPPSMIVTTDEIRHFKRPRD